ncbi:MAG: YihY/virulence factor BrkB family protein [Myxococcales bacterium]|nr:YihY/virulence factor BrkB family protein [Myxococcales bacterium]
MNTDHLPAAGDGSRRPAAAVPSPARAASAVEKRSAAALVLLSPWGFALQVLRGFRSHQGLLLAGAVAYYTLLSIVPLFGLLMLVLSSFYEERELLAMSTGVLEMLVPGQSPAVVSQIEIFLHNRYLIGWLGFLVMLFFSSLAFTVLENAMSVIFFHRVAIKRRRFVISATLPFIFIGLLGLGLALVTVISTAIQTAAWMPIEAPGPLLYLVGFAGLVMVLTAIYLVMPVGKLSLRHALVGGVTAAVLWEIARHVLIWYFRTLSMVDLIYGTFATAVLALLSLEVAAIIVLLGGQVIAEYERLAEQGQ